MAIFHVAARVLLRAVADAEVDALMLPFGDHHPRRHFVRLLRDLERLDRHELKQLHPVETALRVLNQTAPVELAGLVGDVALDDAVADAAIARHLHRPEVRELPGLRHERQGRFLPARAGAFVDRHLGVRVAVIAQFVERHFLGRDHLLTIPRAARLQGYGRGHGARGGPAGIASKPMKFTAATVTGSPSEIVTVRSTASCSLLSFTSNDVTRASGYPRSA